MAKDKEESRREMERLILTYWNLQSVPYYFSEVLSGQCSIKETIKDLKSFERDKKSTQDR